MKIKTRTMAMALLLAAAAGSVWANNLQVTNVTVIGRDTSTAYVKFDISWENSWRSSNTTDALYFHDAAWVFFKVLPDATNAWQHVVLEGTGTNPTDYVVGTGTGIELVVPPDRVGLFVRRSADGDGATSVQNVKAVWNFASNSLLKTDKVKIQAFGVEMVYVARGSFKVGSGGTGSGELYEGGGGTSPFPITNAGPILCSNAVGCLWGASQSGATSMGGNGTLSNSFPNGYNAFYCMKYEITQGQYKDFLNTLTRDQQASRCTATNLTYYMWYQAPGSATISARNTVQMTLDPGSPSPRTYSTIRPDRACNYLSWVDVGAFADWAGLRPMTELEFEKACRGPVPPVANEYAWGRATIMGTASMISGTENGTETATNNTSAGGCHYNMGFTGGDGGSGPLRVGIYATNGVTRAAVGASYWGIMELSGNIWERPVTIGNANGRAFTGLHGNGILTAAGAADVGNWPAPAGIGMRGGSLDFGAMEARVSDREVAAYGGPGSRYYGSAVGGRAVRTAP